MNDNFTCISKKGASVVDYIIMPYDKLEDFQSF